MSYLKIAAAAAAVAISGAAIVYGIVRNKKERVLVERANAAIDRYNNTVAQMNQMTSLLPADYMALIRERDGLGIRITGMLLVNNTMRHSVTEAEVESLEKAVDKFIDNFGTACARATAAESEQAA